MLHKWKKKSTLMRFIDVMKANDGWNGKMQGCKKWRREEKMAIMFGSIYHEKFQWRKKIRGNIKVFWDCCLIVFDHYKIFTITRSLRNRTISFHRQLSVRMPLEYTSQITILLIFSVKSYNHLWKNASISIKMRTWTFCVITPAITYGNSSKTRSTFNFHLKIVM